jgi:hypothetical protein
MQRQRGLDANVEEARKRQEDFINHLTKLQREKLVAEPRRKDIIQKQIIAWRRKLGSSIANPRTCDTQALREIARLLGIRQPWLAVGTVTITPLPPFRFVAHFFEMFYQHFLEFARNLLKLLAATFRCREGCGQFSNSIFSGAFGHKNCV